MYITRDNNFDLIRLLAALQVAVCHTFRHLHIADYKQTHILGYGFQGVFCFFVISGFLIAASYDRNHSFKHYIKNRLLRIVPALYMAFVLTVLVLYVFGFINPTTIKNPTLWAWGFGQLTLFQFYTPDLLRPFGVGAPNGSLWTIPVEFMFYLLLPLLFLAKNLKAKNIVCIICIGCSLSVNMLITRYGNDGIICKILMVSIIPWLYSFLIGSLLYFNWVRVKHFFEGKALLWLVLFIIYVKFIARPSYNILDFWSLGANLLLALFTISLAYTKPQLGRILHGFDISYGVYVYHMIIVNIFVQVGLVGETKYAIMILCISVVLSCMSWTFVEKKALRLKSTNATLIKLK